MIVCVPSSLKPNIQSPFLIRCNGERTSVYIYVLLQLVRFPVFTEDKWNILDASPS